MTTNAAAGADALRHVPRAYQEEIFAQAQRANVIAALDTGSGKTLIAAMLVRWAAAQPGSAASAGGPNGGGGVPGKKIVFLVPKVPLVDQQREFLARQTPLEVRGYVGAIGTDAWDRGRWMKEFKEADVLVMTAQIFKNILTHGYWTMDKVSLLIFDECHHARQNHPYNMIMEDHYSVCTDKPRVFGMTASPTWQSKDPTRAITMLQLNLYAKIMVVREHVDQLRIHSYRPIEIVLRYPSSPSFYPSYSPSLWDYIGRLKIPDFPNTKLQIRYIVTLNELGPAGSEYFLVQYIRGVLKAPDNDAERMDISPPASPRRRTSSALAERRPIINASQANQLQALADASARRLTADVHAPIVEWLSPKVRAMIRLLNEQRSVGFHGIIFVEQRQVATSLAWILDRAEETKGWIRCAVLTGHGESFVESTGMSVKEQKEVVKTFRAGGLNLLVATSVAEEGLDFPACKIVVRFNEIRNMVGYLQSRGRARQQKSLYVVMIEENDTDQLDRYEKLQKAEPGLRDVYRQLNARDELKEEELDLEDEQDDARDLGDRESYIISSTGASLNYSSAISILEHLCSLIPRDPYTPSLQPKYSGDFTATVRLPRALPLAPSLLTYTGPTKHSKKEAKRAVAFIAARSLHALGVLNEYLSPIQSKKGDAVEDADGRPVPRVGEVPVIMDVHVVSPWQQGPPWFMHTVVVDGERRAGLLNGKPLPNVGLRARGMQVQLERDPSVAPLELDADRLNVLGRFTKMGIWWCATGSPINSQPACYLAPLDDSGNLDWGAMEQAVVNEKGSYDWSDVSERDEGSRLLMNGRKHGRMLVLKKIRTDIALDQKPSPEVVNGDFESYARYFEHEYQDGRTWWSKKLNQTMAGEPPSGPILEVRAVPRSASTFYDHRDDIEHAELEAKTDEPTTFLLPRSYCKQTILSPSIRQAFRVFAPLCQRVTDVFRATSAIEHLRLPNISLDRMAEALILPSSWIELNNQRLETLGDSVLKLAVVTYVFMRFPMKHEGQLEAIKSNCISNRTLLARAKAIGLERFLTSEGRGLRSWQFVFPDGEDAAFVELRHEKVSTVRRSITRRSLQDCMEATLGASYLTGGIDMALQAGTALGLCFGGGEPWFKRSPSRKVVPTAPLFTKLQEDLKYHFTDGNLLAEAVTHPSYEAKDGSCYQRLEFLGDAVIELVVTTYLFNKFSEAKSGEMSWVRAHALCNATLAALAVSRLQLHKYLLSNNVWLNRDIAREVTSLADVPLETIVVDDWKYGPPKVLGDVFESVIGAIFVDSNFDYLRVTTIVETLMEDVLKALRLDIPHNPITRLLEWMSKSGCVKAKFQKAKISGFSESEDKISAAVLVHGTVVAGPVGASNAMLARGLAAEQALATLADMDSEHALHRICDCGRRPAAAWDESRAREPEGATNVGPDASQEEEEPRDLPVRAVREKDLDTETEPGFATVARMRLQETMRDREEEATVAITLAQSESESEIEHEEVELIFGTPSATTTSEDLLGEMAMDMSE